MSRPPSLIYVGPADYVVKIVKRLDLLGETNSADGEIYLQQDQCASSLRGTLVHELIHAIVFESGLQKVHSLDHESEEQLVSVLAPWIYALIIDNPALIEWLTASERKAAA